MKKDRIIFQVDHTVLVKKIIDSKLQGPLGGAVTGMLKVCEDLIEGDEKDRIIAQHNAHYVMRCLKEWTEEK